MRASFGPVRTFTESAVNDTIEENARFMQDSGLKTTVTRNSGGKCCDWCAKLDGTWEYGKQPKDFFRQHENCTCSITFRSEKSKRSWNGQKGKRQIELPEGEEDGNLSEKGENLERRLKSQYDLQGTSPSIPEKYKNDFSDYEKLSLSREEMDSLAGMRKLSESTGYEYSCYSNANGKIIGLHTDKKANEVSVPKLEKNENNVTLLHSHTNVTPLSRADLSMLTDERVNGVGNIAINGDVHVVRIGDGYRPEKEEYEYIASAKGDEADISIMNYPDYYEWTGEEKTYMAIREQEYLIARYFGWIIEGANIDGL